MCLNTVRSFTPATRRSGHAGQVEGGGGGGAKALQEHVAVLDRWSVVLTGAGGLQGPHWAPAASMLSPSGSTKWGGVTPSLALWRNDASTLRGTRSRCAASSWGRAGVEAPSAFCFVSPHPPTPPPPTHALLTGAACIVLAVLVVAFETLSDVAFSRKRCAFHSRCLFADGREV